MRFSSKTWGVCLSAPIIVPLGVLLLAILRHVTSGTAYENEVLGLLRTLMFVSPVIALTSLFLLWQQRGGPLVTFCFGASLIWLVLSILVLALHWGWFDDDFHPISKFSGNYPHDFPRSERGVVA